MGGGRGEDLSPFPGPPRTLVLMGRTGNGKSATANSILGRLAFDSWVDSGGVTVTAQFGTSTLKDGRVVNVIDTPGLFNLNVENEIISWEIMKCVSLAQNGFHAVLLVFSVCNHFTEEEAAAVGVLQAFFGPKITDYMIVVFTHGDAFVYDDEPSYFDYLDRCPQPLKEILKLCNNRCVLFNNKTADEKQKRRQLEKLFSLVDDIVAKNGGQAYTYSLFADTREAGLQQMQKSYDERLKKRTEKVAALLEQKKEVATIQELPELTEPIQKPFEQLKKMTETFESLLRAANDTLLKELERERALREKAEKDAHDAMKKSEITLKEANDALVRGLDRVRAEKVERDARDAIKAIGKETETREEMGRKLNGGEQNACDANKGKNVVKIRVRAEKVERDPRDAIEAIGKETETREEMGRKLNGGGQNACDSIKGKNVVKIRLRRRFNHVGAR